jgi:hypothetical protein
MYVPDEGSFHKQVVYIALDNFYFICTLIHCL